MGATTLSVVPPCFLANEGGHLTQLCVPTECLRPCAVRCLCSLANHDCRGDASPFDMYLRAHRLPENSDPSPTHCLPYAAGQQPAVSMCHASDVRIINQDCDRTRKHARGRGCTRLHSWGCQPPRHTRRPHASSSLFRAHVTWPSTRTQ